MEVGPGKGAITYPILKEGLEKGSLKRFWLVERDQKIVEHWVAEIGNPHYQGIRFEVESGDFLELEESRWAKEPQFVVVSNLPYSAGTAIFTRLAARVNRIPAMVLMFQQEVAQRLRAEPNTKARGSLSIWVQNLWDVEKLMAVPPRAFAPPPEVTSEVVILTRRAQPRVIFPQVEGGLLSASGEAIGMDKFWEFFLKTCFSQRRKMLRSSLPWRNALELSGVDGTKRAEALDWEELNCLFRAVVREVSGV
jgi:16S rRNA (adenine1518-N6/adenine1519-N6)-dimethyltransferase